jgi:hypothetical protein
MPFSLVLLLAPRHPPHIDDVNDAVTKPPRFIVHCTWTDGTEFEWRTAAKMA